MTWDELDKADPSDLLLLAPELGNSFPPVRLDSTVTIGMAAHGNLQITLFALRALFASVCGDFELILVDDESPDQTGKLFELVPLIHPNTKIFRFPKNVEYSGSLNAILSHATGDRIIFLSNDIFVSPAFISELLLQAEYHTECGLVRGCSNFVDNRLITHNIKDCGELNNFYDLFEYARVRSETFSGKWLDDPFLTGDAFLVTRELLDAVGYLDERFYGYFVDHDLGVRARQAGFHPRLALGAFAWHQDGANMNYLSADEKRAKLDRRWARVNQNWAVFKLKYNLPVSMAYEGMRRVPWDGLAQLPLQDKIPPCDNSEYCLPSPGTGEWREYRASSLLKQARIAMYGGNLQQAESLCNNALKLARNSSETLTVLGSILVYKSQLPGAMKAFRRAMQLDGGNFKAHSNLLLCMNYAEACSQQTIYRESRKWEKLHSAARAGTLQGHAKRSRIRIAYISPDFRRHSVAYFFLPLLENHDRSQFEVFCLSDTKFVDEMTKQMVLLADGWRDISNLSDDEAENVIREVNPDVLIDLAGHTGQTIRLGLLSRRLAPVQISWLGYPNTTGLSSIDFRFTDAIADPPSNSDKLHSEQLVRLPDCFLCYKAPEEAPEVSVLPAIANGFITFGSFNMLPKIQDMTVKVWAEILNRVPGSKILLKNHYFRDDSNVDRMLERCFSHGVTRDRVIIKASDPDTASHLSQYANMDIALDTFPYNGTTTTCEALWMGVPVITLSGDRHAGRVGESLLRYGGSGCGTAHTIEDYVEKAVYLAADLERLAGIRSRLRMSIQTSNLCSASLYTERFESALKTLL